MLDGHFGGCGVEAEGVGAVEGQRESGQREEVGSAGGFSFAGLQDEQEDQSEQQNTARNCNHILAVVSAACIGLVSDSNADLLILFACLCLLLQLHPALHLLKAE